MRQNGFDVGALRDAESEYEWRMAVQPPQSDTIYFETTGDTGQFETFKALEMQSQHIKDIQDS